MIKQISISKSCIHVSSLKKPDSEDSGNEEPHGEQDFYVKREGRSQDRVIVQSGMPGLGHWF